VHDGKQVDIKTILPVINSVEISNTSKGTQGGCIEHNGIYSVEGFEKDGECSLESSVISSVNGEGPVEAN
jgi:hypothetical protein